MTSRESHPATTVREMYSHMPRRYRVALFVVGVTFLSVAMGGFILDKIRAEEQTAKGIIVMVTFIVSGLFLVLTEQTLRLLAIVPLPAFMHRGKGGA